MDMSPRKSSALHSARSGQGPFAFWWMTTASRNPKRILRVKYSVVPAAPDVGGCSPPRPPPHPPPEPPPCTAKSPPRLRSSAASDAANSASPAVADARSGAIVGSEGDGEGDGDGGATATPLAGTALALALLVLTSVPAARSTHSLLPSTGGDGAGPSSSS
jgi:hypothetical protein